MEEGVEDPLQAREEDPWQAQAPAAPMPAGAPLSQAVFMANWDDMVFLGLEDDNLGETGDFGPDAVSRVRCLI
jgi:hypothetical protein